MKNNPLISVIMPSYNAEAYLADTVTCVFEQSYPNIELIVVDDGSTDKCPEILSELDQKYPALTVFYQKNKGPYPARNFALQHAKGDFIAFMDADDYWASDCLEKLYNRLIESNADLSYCGWQNIVENGEDGPPYIPPAYEQGDVLAVFYLGVPGQFIRHSPVKILSLRLMDFLPVVLAQWITIFGFAFLLSPKILY